MYKVEFSGLTLLPNFWFGLLLGNYSYKIKTLMTIFLKSKFKLMASV